MISKVVVADGLLRPANDRNIGRKATGPSDLDVVLPMLLPHLKRRRTCIQAGACLGVWPLAMAEIFDRVVSFEPEPTNFYCATQNTAGADNIELHEAALGSDTGSAVGMRVDPSERTNPGAHYVVHGAGDIPIVAIDDLGFDDLLS